MRSSRRTDLKVERGVGGDLGRRALSAIRIWRFARQYGLFALLHGDDTLVPSLDDCTAYRIASRKQDA